MTDHGTNIDLIETPEQEPRADEDSRASAISRAIHTHRRDAERLREAVVRSDEPVTVLSLQDVTPGDDPEVGDALPVPSSTHQGRIEFATVASVLDLLNRRAVSSRELTELMLLRIEGHSESVNTYITVIAEQALADADLADRERGSGSDRPQLGIPIALKDLFDTAGVRTTAGSRILSQHIPSEDATVVKVLHDAGAVILGKTHMAEFAYGFPHPDYGPSRTPWDLSRSARGSSGGSGAAVAAGLAYGALGSDTGGSIRSPAAACGITGLKPTYGLVSRHGVVPLSWSMDHVGPMARSAEDARLILDIITAYDSRDPAAARMHARRRWPRLSSLDGIRIGVLTDLTESSEAVVQDAVMRAIETLRKLGAEIVETTLPMSDVINAIAFGTMEPEAASFHARWLREQPDSYAPRTRNGLLAASSLPATQYVDAQRLRARFNRERASLYEDRGIDLLLSPTEPAPPWPIEFPTPNESHEVWDLRHTVIANLNGMLALPCGFTEDGLPLSLQLFALPFHDDLALRVGEHYQSVTDWQRRVPPGFV